MLNDIKSREDVMFTVELGMRAYVCLSTENDPTPPPYIAGITGYLARTEGDEEAIHMERWWIAMWSQPASNVTVEEALSMLIHQWRDRGISDETITVWLLEWESRPLYDEAHEDAMAQMYWEEAIAEGRL